MDLGAHLEVRKVLRHEIVDLADRKAPSFTVLKGHEDEDAEGRESLESLNLGQAGSLPLTTPPVLARVVEEEPAGGLGERLYESERRKGENASAEVRNYGYTRVLWNLRALGCNLGLVTH